MLTGHALHLLFDVDKVKCHCLDDTLLSYIEAVKKKLKVSAIAFVLSAFCF